MRISILAALAAALVLTPAAHGAAVEEVTRKATGYGETPDAAVTNALVEASRQALGVSVALDPDFRSATHEWVVRDDVAMGHWSSRPEARAPTLANVSGYRVLSTREVRERLWQAEVEAKLLRSKSLGPDRSALPGLVVAPVRATAESYRPGEQVPAAQVRSQLHRALVNAFSASGRVRVLDRSYPAELEREAGIAAAGLSPLEHARLGQQMGADLLLTTEVERFDLGRETDTFYGARLNVMEPVVRIHYQLIDTATHEILEAGTWSDGRSAQVFQERLRKAGIEPAREPGRIGEVLYPDVARALVGESLEALYPLRILSAVDADAVYISQGEGRLEEGDLVSVRRDQGEVRDPDSGVAIHLDGPVVATLRVTAVEKGYARTELVTGDLAALAGADLSLQREVPVAEAPPNPGKPLTPGSSEAPIKW